MVNEKICIPLNPDKSQTENVDAAFKDFYERVEKLMDKSVRPLVMPEKSKVDALGKIRDEKVKEIIPSELYAKYLELELALRPFGHQSEGNRIK